MKAAEIEDFDGLEAWLKEQPVEASAWVASRAAARVVPVFWQFAVESRDTDLAALPGLRALLISGARASELSHGIDTAAEAAANAAFTARTTFATRANAVRIGDAACVSRAFSAAAHAAALLADRSVVLAADAAARVLDTEVRAYYSADAETWEEDGAVSSALWMDGTPEEIAQLWAEVQRALPRPDPSRHEETARGPGPEVADYHGFWVPWYQGLLDGKPAFDPKLIREVALIDPEDWDKGDVHINNVVIPALMEKYRTTLSRAFPVDFSFDSLAKIMRVIGIGDDTAHLRDPVVVQGFLDDCEELRDTLTDFKDYATELQGGNFAGVLRLAAEKVLDELTRTRDQSHLRARYLVRLGNRLETFSKDEKARDDLGESLSGTLDESIGLMRDVLRKHLAPSYAALAPLSALTLDHIDQSEVVRLMDGMIARLETLPTGDLVALDEEGIAVLRDMTREARDYRAAIAEATSDDFRMMMESRLTESLGATGLAFARFLERSRHVSGKADEATDGAIRMYKKATTLAGIWKAIQTFLNGPGG